MIFVARAPEPKALQKNKTKWLNKLQKVLSNPNSTQRSRDLAYNKYRHKEVKNTLKQMFHEKCAYCESEITTVTYGDIEHFRPKSTFPDLTFEWDNLLFSCNVCNDDAHKGTLFPLDANGEPLLIDPTHPRDSIEEHLDFIWDEHTESAFVIWKDDRGKKVVEIFDLNGIAGRTPLLRSRSAYINHIKVLVHYAQKGDNTARILLTNACHAGSKYSAFTRNICREAGMWP